MALRVTRGLFRLWLVLTVLWIGCVGTTAWVVWPPAPDIHGLMLARELGVRKAASTAIQCGRANLPAGAGE
jgi:hypothetical protein